MSFNELFDLQRFDDYGIIDSLRGKGNWSSNLTEVQIPDQLKQPP